MARDPSSSTRPPHLTTTPEFLQPWASAQMASGRSGKNRAVPSPGSPGNYPLLTLCCVTTSVLQCYLRKARCKEKKKKQNRKKATGGQGGRTNVARHQLATSKRVRYRLQNQTSPDIKQILSSFNKPPGSSLTCQHLAPDRLQGGRPLPLQQRRGGPERAPPPRPAPTRGTPRS